MRTPPVSAATWRRWTPSRRVRWPTAGVPRQARIPQRRFPPIVCCAAFPALYSRVSGDLNWRTEHHRPVGQVFTPFFTLARGRRFLSVQREPGSIITCRPAKAPSFARCRSPASSTDIRSSAFSLGARRPSNDCSTDFTPQRDGDRQTSNEDAQSLVFDDSNLFRVNKFSGWDRLEDGGRANVGVHTPRSSTVPAFSTCFSASRIICSRQFFRRGRPHQYRFGKWFGDPESDYVARVSYQPNDS